MQSFIYQGLPSRIVFGAGALSRVKEEVEHLGAKKALVLCTPEQRATAEDVARHLGSCAIGIYDRAVMHVPMETALEARKLAESLGADSCVAVGGGSTIGLGKAIALTSNLPIVAVPTTFAGSEATPIYGLTEGGIKKTGRDKRVLPRTVIYDPTLTLSLPADVAGPSGINAIAHAVEALYAADVNPIVSLMAQESIRALASSLPNVVADPRDLTARTEALYGAWLAGTCLGMVGMSLHHQICHLLGGAFNLPHAQMHAILLPHAVAYNRNAAREALELAGRALGVADAADGLYALARKVGGPLALRQIGMPEDGLEEAARLATRNPYHNPRPVEFEPVLELLRRAWRGDRP
jgi:maleylacetate reductase